jgi:hypothetical protein
MKNSWDNVLLMLLSPSEAVLLMVLMERAGDEGKPIVVPYPVLSKLTRVAITSVGKHVRTLECLRFITVDIDDKTNGNSYLINWNEIDKAIRALNELGDLTAKVNHCDKERKKALSRKNDST